MRSTKTSTQTKEKQHDYTTNIERGSSSNNSSIPRGKHALVFGAAGSVGAAVAKEFAAEGAEVFLAGRTKSTVDEVAQQSSDPAELHMLR